MRCSYTDLISTKSMLSAWKEFLKGKRKKPDVQEFEQNLMDNLLSLQEDLRNHTYYHGEYASFGISDPKPRIIHKASVRDRLLHHIIHQGLYPFFDARFISNSYSCRVGKGTHKALERFKMFSYKVSKNNTKTCWVLKCDLRKFFASINHAILLCILEKGIQDDEILWLLKQVITSFDSGSPGKGLPLGNLTSQLLVNVYMNRFDQYVKHVLKVKYYVRYADDFVLLSEDRSLLVNYLAQIGSFLEQELKLQLHPNKVSVKTLYSGIDFLGWIHFPTHRVLRTTTKRRMFRQLHSDSLSLSLSCPIS